MKIKILMLLLATPFIISAQLTHKVSFSDVKVANSKTDEGFITIDVDGLFGGTEEEGAPILPVKTLRFSVPLGSEIESVEMLNPVIKSIKLEKKVMPFQGSRSIQESISFNEFVSPLEAIYRKDAYYPAEQVMVSNVGYFDYTNQIVTISVYPAQYNPKANMLRFCSSFTLRINYKENGRKKADFSQTKIRKSKENGEESNRILATMVDNPQDIVRSSLSDEPLPAGKSGGTTPLELTYEYVIVTSDSLAPAFRRFAAWKKRKGINIGIVPMGYIRANYTGDLISGIYDDAGKLRQYLFDAYNNGLVYALLGGDMDNVPIRRCHILNNNTSIEEYIVPTDFYFGEFNRDWNGDGDDRYGERDDDANFDFYPEIYVGRLLCSNTKHIENWTNKALCYEINPGNGNYAYLRKAFYTQADEMQLNHYADSIKAKFTMFTTNKVFEETYQGVVNYNAPNLPEFPTGADVIAEINKNYGFISLMGHGSPCGVSVANVGFQGKLKGVESGISGYNVYTSAAVHSGYRPGGSLVGLTNFNYPNVYYSVSCENMPYDGGAYESHQQHKDNFGKYYTVMSETGGVAFLGNTRSVDGNATLHLVLSFGDEIKNNNYNLGKAEGLSKANSIYRRANYSHNLLGCPEMEMWTGLPSTYNKDYAKVVRSGNNVIVSDCAVGSKVCVMSADDNGTAYFEVRMITDASHYTFAGVTESYFVTITKHDYIPFIYESNDVYIQNETITGNHYVSGANIYAGKAVTGSKPQGDVILQPGSNVTFDADDDVILERGFEVKKGAIFNVE